MWFPIIIVFVFINGAVSENYLADLQKYLNISNIDLKSVRNGRVSNECQQQLDVYINSLLSYQAWAVNSK